MKVDSNAFARTVLLLLLAAATLGCATNSKNKWKFASLDPRRTLGLKKEEEKPEPQVPTRLVATWTEAVLNTAGEAPKRGFGGRIAFFTRESKDPVRVDGQLVVYAFDETGRQSHETQPTRRYVFPADEVVRHESETALGPAYSFWLPWDEVGGPQKNISLIARFEPQGGPIVIGEQTRHFLPGSSLDAQAPQYARDHRTDMLNGVRLASYADPMQQSPVPDLAEPLGAQANSIVDPTGKGPISASTIPLPPRLATALKEQQARQASGAVQTQLPLSQQSTFGPSGPLGPSQPIHVTPPTTSAATAALTEIAKQSASRPATRPATGRREQQAAPGSLRDSLLSTLPAQARQSAQAAPAPAP
jgi:hypothetical protein